MKAIAALLALLALFAFFAGCAQPREGEEGQPTPTPEPSPGDQLTEQQENQELTGFEETLISEDSEMEIGDVI